MFCENAEWKEYSGWTKESKKAWCEMRRKEQLESDLHGPSVTVKDLGPNPK